VATLARNGPRPRRLVQSAAIAIALTIVAFASSAATTHEEVPLPAGRMTHLVHHNFEVAGPVAGQRKNRLVLHNFEVVGHSVLGGGIAFADVWAHRTFAYVGSSCGASRTGGGGVRVVDVSRPARPKLAGSLQNDPFTRAEDVVVRHVRTPSFTGDLAVVGIQACLGSGHEDEVQTGLAFFDVSDPVQPHFLSSGSFQPARSAAMRSTSFSGRTASFSPAARGRRSTSSIEKRVRSCPEGSSSSTQPTRLIRCP
jgi:hypothetical protein